MVRVLINVGYAEGISYLLLLLVAMPLKYVWGEAWAVRFTGSAHGFLFIVYVAVALYVAWRLKFTWRLLLQVLAATLIPFGPWWVDSKILRFVREKAQAGEE